MRPLAPVPERMTAPNGPSHSSSEGSAGEALRKSQAHFRQLVEGVRNYAIFLLDAHGDVASWNQGAERIKGYSADEIIGKHFSAFYPPESIEQGWPEQELQLAKDEGRLEDEGWRVRKDGSRFWASVTITALRDENGNTEGFLKITRDLTARKQAEEQSARLVREQAAREAAEISERRALFLAEASEALAASLDEEEIYQEVVRIAVPFLADICIVDRLEEGFARIAAVNQSNEASPDVVSRLSEYYPIEPHDRYLVAEVLRTGRPRIFGDVSKLSQLAVQFQGEQAEAPLLKALSAQSAIVVPLIKRGEILGAISFIITDSARPYDLTEIALAQELGRRVSTAIDHALLYTTAQEAQHKAEMAGRAKDRFLAMLSHELRTPLTPILFSSSLLTEEPTLSETMREHLRVIVKNAQLEARLVDDLLDVTRISRGKFHLNFGIADAHEVLRTVLETCSADLANKQLRLSVELEANNYQLRADVDRLQQVFWNLLKNAIKFTPPGGWIAIRSKNLRSDLLRVEIQDSGKGIAPGVAARIFDPFEQGERSEGLGLGLAICKSIVELHGGRIAASSHGLGKGATFVVEIPATAK
ncbi:MAG: ATP-binding protein [Chthoniobacterales bacterium]